MEKSTDDHGHHDTDTHHDDTHHEDTHGRRLHLSKMPRHESMCNFQDGKRFSAKESAGLLEGSQVIYTIRASSRRLLNAHNNSNGNSNSNISDASLSSSRKKQSSLQIRMDKHQYFNLYRNYPLVNSILEGTDKRQAALKESGERQMNHVRGTDGWGLSMFVIEVRAMDNYLGPWIIVIFNALLACLLQEVLGVQFPAEQLQHWDSVYSMVLKSALAFLLVFRLNRCAMRYWEARGLWGNITHSTRNLIGAIIMYGDYDALSKPIDGSKQKNYYRDMALSWGSIFCVATKLFIRSDHTYPVDEFSGFLSSEEVTRLRDSNHSPLMAASMCRYYLQKLFHVDATTSPAMAHAYSIRLQECDQYISSLVAQVSGMEKIRSTPLPIAYVTHLRTFLFGYCMVLPYIWVEEWSWSTIPLIAFTFFALAGIEGVSQEVEIPFRKERPNHLAMDAYCLVILESVKGMLLHDANMHIHSTSSSSCGQGNNSNSNINNVMINDEDNYDEDSETFNIKNCRKEGSNDSSDSTLWTGNTSRDGDSFSNRTRITIENDKDDDNDSNNSIDNVGLDFDNV